MNEQPPEITNQSWGRLVRHGISRVKEYLSGLVGWVGAGRILATAVGVGIVVAGAWWVMQTPPPPVESRIAFAATSVAGASASPFSPQFTPVSTIAAVIFVHVAGEVRQPGVVKLSGGDRVIDALNAAGGPTSLADLNSVNLAAPLLDAAQVYVPKRGEVPKRQITRPLPGINLPTTLLDSAISSSPSGAPVDLNSATEQQLDALPGVGPSTARAILAYRTAHGPFSRVEELLNVRGIGPVKLDALRDLVRV